LEPEVTNEASSRSAIADAVTQVLPVLRARLGDRVTTSLSVREHHGTNEGVPVDASPDAVVFAESSEEVAFVARTCYEAGVPMIPFGTGTSLEGHVAAIHGGITVDVSRMDQVLDVSIDSLDCRVQAGVTREQLNARLRGDGLFFPIDPGANASLGGMAATRASGTAAVRYGTMREAVLGLTVVTPDGRIVKTGTRARKTAAGLDLTRLFVGSEGVLGFITEVQLKLWGLPEVVKAAACQFPSSVRCKWAYRLLAWSCWMKSRSQLASHFQSWKDWNRFRRSSSNFTVVLRPFRNRSRHWNRSPQTTAAPVLHGPSGRRNDLVCGKPAMT
jgi:FAD/FMN-containing dehydrogenase